MIDIVSGGVISIYFTGGQIRQEVKSTETEIDAF